MQNALPNSVRLSSARVFTEKYAWMLNWALQFTQNDQALAEDLVQETFLRVSRSYPYLDEIKDVEALLYVSLKNAYLGELRRTRRRLFEDLDAIEYDSAVQSLRESRFSDSMATQNELRRVAAYLCWRNQVTKPPSILILRFFHECLPAEIAHIAQISLKAVNLALLRGREDLCTYLGQGLGAAGMPGVPVVFPKRESVSSDELLAEVFATIYQSKRTACFTRDQLLRRYESPVVQPISCDLLAHIVACRDCLRIVQGQANDSSSTNKPVDPPGGHGLRTVSPLSKEGPSKRAKRVVESLERKLLAIYEHEPRSLIVLANSEVLATRDVNSSLCTLKIEVKSETPLELIEIMSEQGFCLLSLFVEAQPPSAPPTIRRAVQFSLDRSLEAVLRFTAEGPIVEVTYINPSQSFASDPITLHKLEAELNDDLVSSEEVNDWHTTQSPEAYIARVIEPWHKNVLSSIARNIRSLLPLWQLGFGLALLAVAGVTVWLLETAPPSTGEFLTKVQRSEVASGSQSGIIVQRIQIQTGRETVERTLHRDARGQRVPKKPKQNDPSAGKLDMDRLETELTSAGIPWNDPLSGAAYQKWHDHQRIQEEGVSQAGHGLIKLTTDISDGLIAGESLTVRKADFHPVARTIHYRDKATVEIAELSYEVVPWSPTGEEWFEPIGSTAAPYRSNRSASAPTLHLHVAPTKEALDEAELSTRLVLAQLHADSGEQIEIVRSADGVNVEGVVEADVRKRQLVSALRQIDNVLPSIRTFDELSKTSAPEGEPKSVGAVESAEAASPLESQLLAAGWSHEQVGALVRRLYVSAVAAKQDGNRLALILNNYASVARLTVRAQIARDALIVHYKAKLLEDIEDERRALAASGLVVNPDQRSPADQAPSMSLTEEAKRNLDLYNELLTSGEHPRRTPNMILNEMRETSDQLEATAGSVDLLNRQDPNISSSLTPKK